MAFWALGKVKNVAGILNVKQVGSKLKNYYTQPKKQQEHPEHLLSKQPQKLSDEQLMQRQLVAYRKLVALQQLILAQEEQKQMKKIEEAEQLLSKLKDDMIESAKQNRKKEAMGKLIQEVQSGNKDLKGIMKENMMLREELEKRRVSEEEGEGRGLWIQPWNFMIMQFQRITSIYRSKNDTFLIFRRYAPFRHSFIIIQCTIFPCRSTSFRL